MPLWLPYKAGEQFALSKLQWIAEHRTKHTQEHLRHGQAIGKAHHLYFVPSAEAEKATTRIRQNQIEVRHPQTLIASNISVQQAARTACIRALRSEAESLLPQRLRYLATQGGFSYASVSIKYLKSRWGSCSAQQEITLNLFLMQLPWHLIDYVLFHELTHTKVMQHGPPFWQELERHSPGAKQLRKEIREQHPTLG